MFSKFSSVFITHCALCYSHLDDLCLFLSSSPLSFSYAAFRAIITPVQLLQLLGYTTRDSSSMFVYQFNSTQWLVSYSDIKVCMSTVANRLTRRKTPSKEASRVSFFVCTPLRNSQQTVKRYQQMPRNQRMYFQYRRHQVSPILIFLRVRCRILLVSSFTIINL